MPLLSALLIAVAPSQVASKEFLAGVTLAADLSKQLITLSTGILALSITFAKDIVKTIERKDIRLLAAAWILYLLTILFALAHISCLIGTLIPIIRSNFLNLLSARIMAAAQIATFVLATLYIIVFGLRVLKRQRDTQRNDEAMTYPE
jgi:Na+/proline symporter